MVSYGSIFIEIESLKNNNRIRIGVTRASKPALTLVIDSFLGSPGPRIKVRAMQPPQSGGR
jgi:hypothetical protein